MNGVPFEGIPQPSLIPPSPAVGWGISLLPWFLDPLIFGVRGSSAQEGRRGQGPRSVGLDPFNAFTKASGIPDENALDPSGKTSFEVQAGSTSSRRSSGGGGCVLTGIEALIPLFVVRRWRKS